jgi:uncharacterized protein (UPF0335 family)
MSNENARLVSLIERIVRIRQEIAGLNKDVADIYKEAKDLGYDKKALQICIRWVLKDCRSDDENLNTQAELYFSQYNTRAGVRAQEAA